METTKQHNGVPTKKSLDIIKYRANNPCLTLQQVGDKRTF